MIEVNANAITNGHVRRGVSDEVVEGAVDGRYLGDNADGARGAHD
jgi:hypothetical protein